MLLRRFVPALVLLTLVLAIACGSNSNKNNAGTSVALPATTLSASPAAARSTLATPSQPIAGTPARPTPAAAPVSGTLLVFAGSSLTSVFNQMGADLQKANPGLTIKFNYGSSAALRTQMAQGAPADVFASADQQNMDGARQDGSIDGPDQLFAKNKLIVITPKGSAKVTSLQDLARPGLNLVLADPSVPVGNFARQVLGKLAVDPTYGAGFDQKVLANLKSNETDDAATVATVQTGQADAAIVYSTDVTGQAAQALASIQIPDQDNVITTYPIALVKNAPNRTAAQAFIAYVRGPQGQATLKQFGFIVDSSTGTSSARTAASESSRLRYEQTGGYSSTFTVEGAVAVPATYGLADLQALPAQTIDVQYLSGTSPTMKTYTGVLLYDVLMAAQPQIDPSVKNDLLRDSILVTGSDGYQVVLAWGEIDPGFEGKSVLLAYADGSGQPLGADEGMARLAVPGDQKGGRYVSNVVSITLIRTAN